MDVADPDQAQVGQDVVCGRAVAPPQLPVGPLPAVQQQPARREAVQVDCGDVTVLARDRRPRAQEHHLQPTYLSNL